MFQRFGRYILLEKIAKGGMAEIWLAKQIGAKGFEKLVVIKKILPQFNENENFTKMFIHEAKIASKLNHPNIVQIYDLGSHQNEFYIVMEYVPGYDLLSILKKSMIDKKQFPLKYAIKLISQAANALYYANNFRDIDTKKLNIVHRDISPQNILVSYDGVAKVVDFGVAKAATSDTTMTKTGVLKGKYGYMSPEQVLGKKLDGRSDIFSLAIVLYEITTAKRLFKSTSELRTLKMITEEKITPPIELYPKYPKALNDIIIKGLAQNRTNRYKSAREFSDALENFLISNQRNVSLSDISKWLKDLFREDITNRIIKNKKLFVDADVFLEMQEVQNKDFRKDKNKFDYKNIENKSSNFEFDKAVDTKNLTLNSNNNTNYQTTLQKFNYEDLKPTVAKKDTHKLKKNFFIKIISILIAIFILYILIFSLSFFYSIYSSNKYLEKSLSESIIVDLPGKELENRIKLFCNKDNIICNEDSIRVIEQRDSLNLSIKYKVKKKLFNIIPFESEYDRKFKRVIGR